MGYFLSVKISDHRDVTIVDISGLHESEQWSGGVWHPLLRFKSGP